MIATIEKTNTEELEFNTTNLRSTQSEDIVLSEIIRRLTSDTRDVQLNDPGFGFNQLWAQRDSFRVKDQVLYRQYEFNTGGIKYEQAVTPLRLRNALFNQSIKI